MIDLSRKQEQSPVSVGLRTMAIGGEMGSARNYRLAAGPIVRLEKIISRISVIGSIQFYKESEAAASIKEMKNKQGTSLLLGWDRSYEVFRGLDFSLGGYFTIDLNKSVAPGQSTAVVSTDKDKSPQVLWGRGIELALRFKI